MEARLDDCDHIYLEFWGGKGYHCSDCKRHITEPADRIHDEDIRAAEHVQADKILEDSRLPNEPPYLALQAFTIAYLIDFTIEHNCWDWSTKQVQQKIVLVSTKASRLRYTEHVLLHTSTASKDEEKKDDSNKKGEVEKDDHRVKLVFNGIKKNKLDDREYRFV